MQKPLQTLAIFDNTLWSPLWKNIIKNSVYVYNDFLIMNFLSFFFDSRKIILKNDYNKISIEIKNVEILKELMPKKEKVQSTLTPCN